MDASEQRVEISIALPVAAKGMIDKIYNLISTNRAAEALPLLPALDTIGHEDPDALALTKGVILADIAEETDDPHLARQAILLMSQLDANRLPETARRTHWYNLGNAYSTAFRLKRIPPGVPRALDDDFRHAKDAYQKSLTLGLAAPSGSEAPLHTNYGSLLRKVGRHVEEIEAYDEALRQRPNFGMGFWNKGKGLCWYSTLIEQPYKRTALLEARRLYRRAGEVGVEPGKERRLGRDLGELEDLLGGAPDAAHTPTQHAADSGIEKQYIRFCVENRLYLHPCPAEAHEAYLDPLSVRFPIPDSKEASELISEDLAQLKREYATARFLLFSYRQKAPDFAFVDRGLFLPSRGRAEGSVYLQFLSLGFRSAYSILDKIAYFLCRYCGMADKVRAVYLGEDFFLRNNRLRPELNRYDGTQLAALYDVSREFSEGQPLYRLRGLRNKLEHRCVSVQRQEGFGKNELSGAQGHESFLPEFDLVEDEFYQDTLRLFKAVRAAIFYVHYFVRKTATPSNPNSQG